MTIYGKRLMEAMAKKGYTVHQLASIAGIPSSTLYCALNNDTTPTAFTLGCLADALDVTMDWLWGRERKE